MRRQWTLPVSIAGAHTVKVDNESDQDVVRPSRLHSSQADLILIKFS